LVERQAPAARVAALRQRLDDDRRLLDRAIGRLVPARRTRAVGAERRLAALSPLAVLGRGYAIVEDPAGRVRSDAAGLQPGIVRGAADARRPGLRGGADGADRRRCGGGAR